MPWKIGELFREKVAHGAFAAVVAGLFRVVSEVFSGGRSAL